MDAKEIRLGGSLVVEAAVLAAVSAGRMRVQLKSPSATICVRWVLVGSPRARAYPKSSG